MSDTARDIQPSELVSTVGLDDLFEADANSFVVDVPELELVRDADANGAVDVRELDGYISVEDAASIIGVSIRAVQKRLKRGTLKGVKTKHGSAERWLVEVSCLPALKPDASVVGNDANSEPVDTSGGELVRELGAKAPGDVRKPDASGPGGDYKDNLIKDLQHQLQAASWRNGYLESKLEEREMQIKLLTADPQKPTFWQLLKAFFVKG